MVRDFCISGVRKIWGYPETFTNVKFHVRRGHDDKSWPRNRSLNGATVRVEFLQSRESRLGCGRKYFTRPVLISISFMLGTLFFLNCWIRNTLYVRVIYRLVVSYWFDYSTFVRRYNRIWLTYFKFLVSNFLKCWFSYTKCRFLYCF